jgi:flavodoxin
MRYLVAYHSRTGHNKTIGEAIAKALSADIDEIIDKKKRSGRISWLRAGRDSTSGRMTEIQTEKNPQEYDIIILGTPIWAGKMTPAIRTYLTQNDLKGKKVAFFICSGGAGFSEVFPKLKELSAGATPIGTLGVTEKQFKKNAYQSQLDAFIAQLK